MLKFEEKMCGNLRKLIVKNITEKDFVEFSCEAKGERCAAKLTKKSPWVEKLSDAEGEQGGIAVFEVLVRPNTQVTWYMGQVPITKQNFR